jgi:hypothetical protein
MARQWADWGSWPVTVQFATCGLAGRRKGAHRPGHESIHARDSSSLIDRSVRLDRMDTGLCSRGIRIILNNH